MGVTSSLQTQPTAHVTHPEQGHTAIHVHRHGQAKWGRPQPERGERPPTRPGLASAPPATGRQTCPPLAILLIPGSLCQVRDPSLLPGPGPQTSGRSSPSGASWAHPWPSLALRWVSTWPGRSQQ